MRLKQIYLLLGIVLTGLIVQAGFVSPVFAAYVTSGTVTSTNLLLNESASSITNFYYDISALPSTSNATIQFGTTTSAWYSAAGVLNASTTLNTLNGANISLSSLGWSGSSFYYKITLYSTSDQTGTPTITSIRLDYVPVGSSGNALIVDTNGNTSIGSVGTSTAGSRFSVNAGGTFGYDYFADTAPVNGLLVEGNVGIGTTSPWATLSVNGNSDLGNSALAGYFTATSTTATSTFAGNVTVGPAASISDQENTLATSTSMTIDWGKGNQQLVRIGTAATTINFSDYSAGQTERVVVCNPPTLSAGALTWSGVDWSGGTAPTQTTTADVCDIWDFIATNATSTLKVFGTASTDFP